MEDCHCVRLGQKNLRNLPYYNSTHICEITYHRYRCYSHSVKLSPSVYAKQNTIVSVFDYFSAVYIRVQLIVQYVVQVVCSR